MFFSKKQLLPIVTFLAVALGSVEAKTHQLKKVIIINETGSGGYSHTNQINFTTNYINTYLGPKYGFQCTIPVNQTAIDALFKDDSLSTYDVIVFNGGTRIGGAGAIGDTGAKNVFQRWLKHGGGLVGIRSLMDHNDTWPWLRDTVFSGTKVTVHSNWGSDANAKAQWDTLKTNGVLNSIKPEYNDIRACFPPLHNRFTYPDEWYSFSVNPRPYTDILLTVDEATYTIPSCGTMGLGHPVAWAYHLPPDESGNVGRFIYNQRGFETGAWDGTSTNHAPITVAQGAVSINGIVYSDTSKDLMTKGFLWQSIRWAAGLTLQSVAVRPVPDGTHNGIFDARNHDGTLQVSVYGMKKYVVDVFNLSGRNLGHQVGTGDREYSFPELKRNAIYMVRVRADEKTYVNRVVF